MHPRLALLALLVTSACAGDDGGTTTASTGTDATSTTAASTSTATTQESTTDSTTTDATTTATTGAPPLMVECEGIPCLMGQVCVSPPSTCDYNQTPPAVVQAPAYCADYPAACIGLAPEMVDACIFGAFCADSVMPEASGYDAGQVDCFPGWYDCF